MPAHEDQKVLQIRAAAQALFLTRGFAHVSTAELARDAGVSKETLYSRFPSKEAVLEDLLDHLIGSMTAQAVAHPVLNTRGDLERALTAFGRALSELLARRDYVELGRIVITELPRLPQIGRAFRHAVPERVVTSLTTLLDSAREAGLVTCADAGAAARMFVGPMLLHMIVTLLLVAPAEGTDSPAPFDVDAHVAVFLKAIT